MNIYKIRQSLNEIERIRFKTRHRVGVTASDVQQDIDYQKNLILEELKRPVEISFEETPRIFNPEDFEELKIPA